MNELGIPVLMVFIGAYIIISSEKVNRTGMALLGMGAIGFVFWGASVLNFPATLEWEHGVFAELVLHIEWDTVLFVTSMMIIVAVAAGSGMFQYLALMLVKPSGGDHRRLFVTFLAFVFGISLFFDTVSTMLIMAPLTIEICKALEINFKPFLVAESITCNFASIPSIVGAVPNLVIASHTQTQAGDLFLAFMPLSIILFTVSTPIFMKFYEKSFRVTDSHRVETVLNIDPTTMIKSRRDFRASGVAIAILVVGFAIGPSIGLPPPLVALVIAAFFLILSHDRANEFLTKVGWDTVFFLVGLFGLVAGLVMTGLIDDLAVFVSGVIAGDKTIATAFMVWIPAMLSAFLDNLPVSMVLAPIAVYPGLPPAIRAILPFALIFAVNIGGYIFTPLGSPANMVAIGYSEVEHDPISFMEFAKIGTILGLIHLTIGTGWLLLMGIFGILLVFLIGSVVAAVLLIAVMLPYVRKFPHMVSPQT
ncbi:MAG: SLC13 family permease [Candidatus Thorarchaeota archaeon]|jgi:Na+/H+ antiporter NhaD/arsenite permease-like protein